MFYFQRINLTHYSIINILKMSQDIKTIQKETAEQQLANHALFITPIKQNTSNLNYFYKSNAFKNIAHQVRQNTEKKFQQIFNQNGSYFVFRSQLKQINRVLPVNKPSQLLTTSITLYQVMTINRKMRRTIEGMVSHNQSLRINLMSRLRQLQMARNRRKQGKIQFTKLQLKRKSITILGQHAKELKEQSTQMAAILEQNTSSLQAINTSIYNLQIRKDNTQNYSTLLVQNIEEQLGAIHQLNFQLKCLTARALNRQNTQIINSKDIVYCMFLVGILHQQLFILGNEKKGQRIKEMSKLNSASKMETLNKLTDRTIHIDCHNSNVVHFHILTTIYMHAKSLFISSLYFIMNRISFFSDDFKHLYDYQLFELNFEKLIHKLMCNQQQAKNSLSLNKALLEPSDNKHRKMLVIVAQKEHMDVIKWILQEVVLNDSKMLKMNGNSVQVRLIESGQQSRLSVVEETNILRLKLDGLDLNNYL